MCFKENYCVIQQGYFILLFSPYHQEYVHLNDFLDRNWQWNGFVLQTWWTFKITVFKSLKIFVSKNDRLILPVISVCFH